MSRAVEEWNDERLNDLAATLQPIPTQVAMLTAGVAHLDHAVTQIQPVPAQIAVLAAGLEQLAGREPRAPHRARRRAPPDHPDLVGTRRGTARGECRIVNALV